jgi:predicted amidohydrolase YtcJ
MVVLGEDILSVDPDRIRRIPIERTIIGGKEVYLAESAPTSEP